MSSAIAGNNPAETALRGLHQGKTSGGRADRSSMIVGTVLHGGVPRTRPRRFTSRMNKKSYKFWRTLHVPGGALLRACMATPRHTDMGGQVVGILCGRTLQAEHRV
jgi:hypothetical protein